MRSDSQTGAAAVEFSPVIAKAASRTLHDAAQPLTVVQGLLELTLLQARSVEEYRESVEAALIEMARVGACFDKVRQIVRLQQPANDVAMVRLSDIAHFALQQLNLPGRDSVLVRRPVSADDFVEVSQSRIQHALSVLLSGALSERPERKVILSIEPVGETYAARLCVTQAEGEPGETLGSAIEMARAIATSAGGKIEVEKSPFCVSLVLPKAVKHQSTDQKGNSDHV